MSRLLLAVCLVLFALGSVQAGDFDCDQVNEWNHNRTDITDGLWAPCSNCSGYDNCFWCQEDSTCYNADEVSMHLTSGNVTCHFCQGKYCDSACSPHGFFPTAKWISGEVILMIFYGVVLGFGAKLIADGSELLLEILDPGIIGGLLLPVLGAVPDSAIVVVSGAMGSTAEAQDQLNVGVGTLAGSTIMLLTIPWAVGLWLARTDIRHGESVDNVLTKGWHPVDTGASVDSDTPTNAKIMLGTSISYLIVQLAAFKYVVHPDQGRHVEKWCAFVGMLVCVMCLIAYCAYQVLSPEWQRKQIREARRQYTAQIFVKNMLSLANQSIAKEGASETSRLLADQAAVAEQTVDVRSVGLKWKSKAAEIKKQKDAETAETGVPTKKSVQDDDEEDKDEGQKPHDWKPIALQAALLMVIGTALVSVFSDPMVDVISDFGNSLNIKAFYVSFIITPVCSNASELISSLVFALKKRKVNTTLVYGQLYGAATMNNTLVLGIFFALIFFRGLIWDFSAETITILVVTLAVGVIGSLTCTYRTWYGVPVLLLYPGALVLVFLIEKFTILQ